jgi:hypothetical protein
LHGMEPIITLLEPGTYRGALTPLFNFGRNRIQMFSSNLPLHNPALLAELKVLVHSNCLDVELLPVYDRVIEHLRRMLDLILRHEDSTDTAQHEAIAGVSRPPSAIEAWDILTWQWTVGKDFLPLLQGSRPRQEAVSIFAHFLVMLRKLESQWWLEGWADNLMGKVWAVLDEEHRTWVNWPMEELSWVPPRVGE